MPTTNPRVTFTLSNDMMKAIEDFKFEHRIRNQTQAIIQLINLGFKALSGDEPVAEPIFTDEQLRIIDLYNNTDPLYQGVAVKIMVDNQVSTKERRA